MSRFPAGPKFRRIGTVTSTVPVPPALFLVIGMNLIVIFASMLALFGLSPQNFGSTLGPVEQALLVLFGLIGSTAVLWSINVNSRLSRPLIPLQTAGVCALLASLAASHESGLTSESSLLLIFAFLAAFYIAYGNIPVRRYYDVLAGRLGASEYQPYSRRFVRTAEAFSSAVTVIAEVLIVLLAVFVVLLFFVPSADWLYTSIRR